MTTLTDFIPTNATVCWTDGRNLFVRYPTKQGSPYVVRMPLSYHGVTSALNLMIENPIPPARAVLESSPPAKHPAVKREKPNFSDEAKAAAQTALQKIMRK